MSCDEKAISNAVDSVINSENTLEQAMERFEVCEYCVWLGVSMATAYRIGFNCKNAEEVEEIVSYIGHNADLGFSERQKQAGEVSDDTFTNRN